MNLGLNALLLQPSRPCVMGSPPISLLLCPITLLLIALCINCSLLGFGSLIPPSSCTPQGLCTNSLFCLEHSFPQQNYVHLCTFHPFPSRPKCHHRGEPCLSTPWYPPSQILVGFLCDLIQFIHMFIICLGTWLCWSSALENKLCESRNSDDFTLLASALKRE